MIVGLDPELVNINDLNTELVDLIPSWTLREYLKSDKYNDARRLKETDNWGWNSYPLWSYMQLATLAEKIMDVKELSDYLDYLAANETYPDNKTLLRLCANDFKKT